MKGVIILKKLILIIMIIGGINWGLIGFFDYNLVASIFGANLEIVSRIIYAVVGLASLWGITFLFKNHQRSLKQAASSARELYEVPRSFIPMV